MVGGKSLEWQHRGHFNQDTRSTDHFKQENMEVLFNFHSASLGETKQRPRTPTGLGTPIFGFLPCGTLPSSNTRRALECLIFLSSGGVMCCWPPVLQGRWGIWLPSPKHSPNKLQAGQPEAGCSQDRRL